MKDAVASKPRSKRNSDDDEERGEKKRNRIKSSKKRRRRRDSSLSSSSSDSVDGPRARRKRAKKPDKRKRASRNPFKKKKKRKNASRKTRHRSISSSSSYSSRSCSTCRGRSSSPGRSVSRSPPPKGRSRRRSGGDGDVERGRSRQRRTASFEAGDGRYRSRSCSACKRSGSRSPSSRGADRGEHKYEEIGEARRVRSALAVAGDTEEVEVGIDGRSEQRDRIIHAYGDFDRYDSRRDSDTYGGAPERNSRQGAIKGAGSTCTEDREVRCNQIEEQTLGIDDVDDGDFNKKNLGGSESVDLETQLRQKALENFKKFRRSLSANTRSDGDQENYSSQTLNHKDSVGATDRQYALKSLDFKLASSYEQQENLDEEIRPTKPRLKSVVNIPAEKDTLSESHREVEKPDSDNTTGVSRNPHLLQRREEPSANMSLQHASVKEKQEKQAAIDTRGSIADDANVNQADVHPSSGLSAHHEMDSGNENKQEGTGSQFQQKTFSRMHDGELVQVSYKVYIPKRRLALEQKRLHG